MNAEVWKPIPGYEECYEASSLGRIRSLPRRTTGGRVLKQYVNKRNGYCYVSMCRDGNIKTMRVHKLVYNAFHGNELPYGYDVEHLIDHIDGNKANNRIENLEAVTQSENQKRAFALGLQKPTSMKRVIDLTTGEIFDSLTDAVRSVGGRKPAMITRVCRGTRSQYRNHKFAYYDDYIGGTVPQFSGRAKRSADMLWR